MPRPTRLHPILFTFLALCGCPASVVGDYEAEKAIALGPSRTMSRDCAPDLRLELSANMVQNWLDEGVKKAPVIEPTAKFDGPLGSRGTVMPSLRVTRAIVVENADCASCLTIKTTLKGPVKWTLGPASGQDRMELSADLQLDLSVSKEGDAWSISVEPSSVKDIAVRTAMLGALAEGRVKRTTEEAVGKRLTEVSQPVEVGTIPATGLPTRDLRVRSVARGLVGELCLDLADRGQLDSDLAIPEQGWELEIANDSLLALARRAAFSTGPQDYDVVAIPSSFAMSGERFDMDFRLWRLSGRGWWRDYHVRGAASVTNKALSLSASSVEQQAESPGAAAVDPLAELGESFIVQTIEESLTLAIPTVQNLETPYGTTFLSSRQVTGDEDSVVLSGILRTPGPPPGTKAPARPGATR